LHTEERPHHCNVCNMSFQYLMALKRHMFKHNNNYPFSCDLCARFYLSEQPESTHACTYWRASLHL
jgi:KRAB domain-containing zinc finger protein